MKPYNSKLKGYIFGMEYCNPKDIEPHICATFGCSKPLTLHEQLHGNLCYPCQGLLKINVNDVLKSHGK